MIFDFEQEMIVDKGVKKDIKSDIDKYHPTDELLNECIIKINNVNILKNSSTSITKNLQNVDDIQEKTIINDDLDDEEIMWYMQQGFVFDAPEFYDNDDSSYNYDGEINFEGGYINFNENGNEDEQNNGIKNICIENLINNDIKKIEEDDHDENDEGYNILHMLKKRNSQS